MDKNLREKWILNWKKNWGNEIWTELSKTDGKSVVQAELNGTEGKTEIQMKTVLEKTKKFGKTQSVWLKMVVKRY